MAHLTYNDGTQYYGETKDSKKHGLGGLYDKNNQCIYQGEWLNDEYSGKGILYNLKYRKLIEINQSGINENESFFVGSEKIELNQDAWIKYQGDFKGGSKNGVGKQDYAEAYFVGRFQNGKINGIGSFQISKNQRIQGIWKDNILQLQL